MTEVNHRRGDANRCLKAPTADDGWYLRNTTRTAHRKGYLPRKEKPYKYKDMSNSGHKRVDPLVGTVCSKGIPFDLNKRRQRRAVAGSKKFVNSRIRERERMELIKIARENNHDE